MHELSVTEGILKICLDEGKKYNVEKIKKINIVVGELTGLMPSCISYYFNIVAKGTLAEEAEISITYEKVKIKCKSCGFEGQFLSNQYVCPNCGNDDYEIVKGREFYIDTMEVE